MLRPFKLKRRDMNRPIDNQHVIEIKALPSPRAIKTKLPITDEDKRKILWDNCATYYGMMGM